MWTGLCFLSIRVSSSHSFFAYVRRTESPLFLFVIRCGLGVRGSNVMLSFRVPPLPLYGVFTLFLSEFVSFGVIQAVFNLFPFRHGWFFSS